MRALHVNPMSPFIRSRLATRDIEQPLSTKRNGCYWLLTDFKGVLLERHRKLNCISVIGGDS